MMTNKRYVRKRCSFLAKLVIFTLSSIFFGLYGTFTDMPIIFPGTAVTLGAFCFIFLLMPSLLFRERSIIHPYFEKKLPDPGSDAFLQGENLSSYIDELDKWLEDRGMEPFSTFGYTDSFENSKNIWYEPERCLPLFPMLLEECRENWMTDDLRKELSDIENALKLAKTANIKFCFHMRWGGVSGLEFERREGSYR